MKFAQEKRRLLGWLALVAPLPLPLNEPRPTGVVVWPVVLLWVAVMAYFLRQVHNGRQDWLSNRSLNLFGLAYLPILVVDLMVSASSLTIRPMMHLALFALAAKLFSLNRERDKWHALLGIFFVFVTATATSTSLGIVVYLLVFLGMGASVLSRFSSLHMESFGDDPDLDDLGRLGRRILPITVLVMIPVFWLLPRFGTPFLFGEGGGTSIIGTGFSDEVRLDGIGRIRTSTEVAVRLNFVGQPLPRPALENLRLRGATYDVYQGDSWERTSGSRPVRAENGELLLAADGDGDRSVLATAEVWLEPLDARALILPNQGIRLLTDYQGPVDRNAAGALSFFRTPRSTISYRVDLAADDTVWAPPPDEEGSPTLDLAGVSPRIRDLAASVAGAGGAQQQATRIEQHLQSEYDYELELLGASGDGAIERFLFERRSGHCEYFASAMVLMLRSQGIPARFVTGFLGTETSAMGYSIVRQSNAHAWVEAYIPGAGWQVFDPTPAAGRPTAAAESLLGLARQAYDWAIFSWDRYIVGFGTGEQRRLVSSLIDWFRDLLAGDGDSAETTGPNTPNVVLPIEVDQQEALGSRFRWGRLPIVLLVLLILGLGVWMRRPRRDPASQYLRLRAAAERAGVNSGSGPLEFVRQVEEAVPEASEPVREAVVLYLEDSFSDRRLSVGEVNRCARETREAVRRLRQSRSRARREEKRRQKTA